MDTLFTFYAADFVGKRGWLWLTFIGLFMACWPSSCAHSSERR